MSDPESQARAHAFNAAIGDTYPRITQILAVGGLSADCINLVTNPETGPQVHALFNVLNNGIDYLINKHDADLARVEKSKEHLQNLVNQSVARLSVVHSSTDTSRRVTSDPDKFTAGQTNPKKRQTTYVNWRSQINRTFVVDEKVFNSELRRITHIAGLLGGDAYDLNRTKFETITENPFDPDLWHWRTTMQVFHELNSQYETLDLSRQMGIDFDKLSQDDKPFANFLAEFNSLAIHCRKTDEQKVEALRLKVEREISDIIAVDRNKPGRGDFAGWTKLCQDVYDDLQEKKHFDSLRNNRRTNDRPAPPLANRQPNHHQYQGEPMQLDAARAGRPNRDECRANNLCFYCKKPGHGIKECEEKRAADAKFGGMSNQTDNGRGRPSSNQRGLGGDGRGNFAGWSPQPGPQQTRRWSPQPPQQSWSPQPPQQFNQGQFNARHPRMRALEPGFVEGEVGSSASSVSDNQEFMPTPPTDSGKE